MSRQPRSATGTSAFRNMLALAGGEMGSRGIAFLAMAYIAREIGPSGFGVVGFATALSGYFVLAVRAGIVRAGVRAVAIAPERAPSLGLGAAVLRLGLASVTFAVVVAIARALDKPPETRLVLVLTSLVLFSEALNTSWVYIGLGRTTAVALVRIVSQAVFAVVAVITVHARSDVPWVPGAQVAGETVAALALIIPLARRAGGIADVRNAFVLLRSAVVPLLTELVRTVIYSFDVVVLGFVASSVSVGLYSSAYRLCFLLVALSAAITTAYLPSIAQAALRGPDSTCDATERHIEMAASVAAPLIGGGLALAVPLMIGLFGAEFAPGSSALRLLLLSVAAVYLHAPLNSALLSTGNARTELRIMTVGATLTIVLDLAVIPRAGIIGAAGVTALSEGIVLLLCWTALRRLGFRMVFTPVLRPTVAAAAMVGSLYLLGTQHTLPLYICAGAVVYVAALAALGAIPADARATLHAASLRLSRSHVRGP